MRVVYVGPFAQPWTTEVAVARALSQLGHEVTIVPSQTSTSARVEELASECDLLLMQGNQLDETKPGAGEALWRRLERRGVVTAAYHLDIFRGLGRAHRVDVEPMWRMQHVFTADGDPETHAWLQKREINHHWLPAAISEEQCVEGNYVHDQAVGVLFVGSRNYHREWPWRAELIRLLQTRYRGRCRIVSDNTVRGRDLNDLYRSARIVVGDSLAFPGHMNYWSDRYYETVGRAGFLIAPHVLGLDEHFIDGLHLRYYVPGDVEQLVGMIDFYLEQVDRSVTRDIATCGMSHVREHHTYRHRVVELLDVVGLH